MIGGAVASIVTQGVGSLASGASVAKEGILLSNISGGAAGNITATGLNNVLHEKNITEGMDESFVSGSGSGIAVTILGPVFPAQDSAEIGKAAVRSLGREIAESSRDGLVGAMIDDYLHKTLEQPSE
jgi:hypothetical protein